MYDLIGSIFFFFMLEKYQRVGQNLDEMVRKLSANNVSAISLNKVMREYIYKLDFAFLKPEVL